MRRGAIIALVVVLVLVIAAEAGVFIYLRHQNEAAEGASQVSESPVMTPAPPPVEAATPTPMPTPEPVMSTPEPTATPLPSATPLPTAEPTPTPVPSKTGSVTSNTGVGLNMTVDWRTENLGDGNTRVYITGKITSYSLDLGGTNVTVSLGDQTTTCSAPSFHIGEQGETTSDLFSTSLDLPSGTSAELKVDWGSKVIYSGVELYTISVTDTVET